MRLTRALMMMAGIGWFSTATAFAQPGTPKTQKIAVNLTFSHALLPKQDTTFSGCILNGRHALPVVAQVWQGSKLHLQFKGEVDSMPCTLELLIDGGSFHSKLWIGTGNSATSVEATDQVLVLDHTPSPNAKAGLSGFLNFRGTTTPPSGSEWSDKNDWVESRYTVTGPFKLKK